MSGATPTGASSISPTSRAIFGCKNFVRAFFPECPHQLLSERGEGLRAEANARFRRAASKEDIRLFPECFRRRCAFDEVATARRLLTGRRCWSRRGRVHVHDVAPEPRAHRRGPGCGSTSTSGKPADIKHGASRVAAECVGDSVWTIPLVMLGGGARLAVASRRANSFARNVEHNLLRAAPRRSRSRRFPWRSRPDLARHPRVLVRAIRASRAELRLASIPYSPNRHRGIPTGDPVSAGRLWSDGEGGVWAHLPSRHHRGETGLYGRLSCRGGPLVGIIVAPLGTCPRHLVL